MEAISMNRLSPRKALAAFRGVGALFLLMGLLVLAATPARGAPAAAGSCVVPAEETLATPYTNTYTICDLGHFNTAPSGIHGIAFKVDDPNTFLIEGKGVLYSMPVIRDADNHITAFSSTVSTFATTTNDGSALLYGPGGVLFYTRWPLNEVGQFKPGSTTPDSVQSLNALDVKTWVTGMRFVPDGFPNAGDLKLITQVQGGASNWYNATFQPDGSGTFDITSATLVTTTLPLSQQFIYVMPGSPLFTDYHTMLVGEWGPSKIVAYTLDAAGSPIPASRQVFINGLGAASSEAMDPVTGDIIFSGGGASGLVSVRGFALPPKPNNDRADLTIVQSLKATVKNIPINLDYALSIKNQGPDAASGMVVSDTIPASLKFLSASSSSGKPCSYDAGSRVVNCPQDTLASGGAALVSISTGFLTQDIVSNCATIKSDTPDPDETNNAACIDYDPSGADLHLGVTGKYSTVGKDRQPGATFKLEVINNGPGTAFKPVITGALPPEMDYMGSTASSTGGKRETVKCSFDTVTRNVTCYFYALKPGQKAWITLVTRAHPEAQQTKYCAQVSSTSPDWNLGDNSGCSRVYLTSADLQTTLTNTLVLARSGKDKGFVRKIHYIMTLVNNGPQQANNLVLSDILPGELSPAWITLPKTCHYDQASRELKCQLMSMKPGGQLKVQLDTIPAQGANVVTNCARASSDTLDLDNSNNEACSSRHLTGVDLSIVKTGKQIRPGKIEFTLSITNTGPDAATELVVSDTLPSELGYVGGGFKTSGSKSSSPGKCSYLADTRTFRCNAKGLDKDKTYTILLQVTTTATTGSVANCAEITSNSSDYDLTNNQSCVLVQLKNGKVTPLERPVQTNPSAPTSWLGPERHIWGPLAALPNPV